MTILLQPKAIVVDEQEFVIHKIPAVAAREITAMYPLTILPCIASSFTGKPGNYKDNEDMMFKLMCFVGKKLQGHDHPLMLTTRELIDNHVKSWETLDKLEWEVLKYNCSFFQDGRLLIYLKDIAQKFQELILKTSTDSSEPLSQQTKPPYMN